MTSFFRYLLPCLPALIIFNSCESVTPPASKVTPESIRFSGKTAMDFETEFVERFPNRNSGMPNSGRAVDWLFDEFSSMGLYCETDSWDIINYSRPVKLENLVCMLPGDDPKEIVVVAHHDQSPATVQGADNDGSGIAILVQLARIFSTEPRRKYTLVFVATDGEEYGMLGTKRFVERHPNHHNIIAGISLDNLGKRYYNGIGMSAIGQFRGYGPLWLQQLARQSAEQSGTEWIPAMKSAVEQILDQAVPISFMDQGPMVAAGIPALGFSCTYPDEYRRIVWNTYHTVRDSVTYQSDHTLKQTGSAAEATIRGLMSLHQFPEQKGPYLYFDSGDKILTGWLLKLALLSVVILFFTIAGFKLKHVDIRDSRLWKGAWGMFSAIWIPLILAILELYVFVRMGLMDEYDLYPATSKDPEIYHPKWAAVALFLMTISLLIWAGNRLFRKTGFPYSATQGSALSFLVVGVGSLIIYLMNPFSVILILPLALWGLIHHKSASCRWMNIIWFTLGGIMVWTLIGYFGFVIMQNGFAILWYLMMMFSCGMIGFSTAMIITLILAAGLLLLKGSPKTIEPSDHPL